MSDVYKLVFRGEVLDGQHAAVVRKRLAEAGSFSPDALDKLFSGRPVVIKRAADSATAARFQALFKKAGARLRILPVEDAAPGTPSPGASETSAPQAPEMPQAADTGTLKLLPPGSDVLTAAERPRHPERDVDTSGLSVSDDDPRPAPAAPPVPGPDVPLLSVAEAGTVLGEPSEPVPGAPAPSFEVAAPGSRLAPPSASPQLPADLTEISFDVAPAGEILGQMPGPTAPQAPDTSHLTLEER